MATYNQPKPISTAGQLESATDDAMAHLSTHGKQARSLIKAHQARLANARNDLYSGDEIRRRVADATKQSQSAADQFKQETQDALATLEDAHKRARMDPSSDPSAQLLAFMKAEKADRQLAAREANGEAPAAIVAQAGKAGDVDMLSAARRAHPEMAPIISQADEPHISDVERAVRGQEAQLPDFRSAAGFNQGQLELAIADPNGKPRGTLLMGPNKTTIPVDGD